MIILFLLILKFCSFIEIFIKIDVGIKERHFRLVLTKERLEGKVYKKAMNIRNMRNLNGRKTL